MDFKTHIISQYGEKFYEALIFAHNESSKSALLLNTDKISDDDFLKLYNLNRHPYINHSFLFDKNEIPLGKTYLHDAGAYYIQDPSAMMVANLLDIDENDIVLDMCSAPGGKAIQLSMKMHNNGVIVANDISYQRSLVLSSNVERMGRKNIIVTNDDFSKHSEMYLNYFTKIVLDAPCSGSGMFRKEQKMMDDWSYEKVLRCEAIQKELILAAYNMLKPGGILSYSTCSYSKEENEDVINFLLNNTDAELIHLSLKDDTFNSQFLPGTLLFTASSFGEGQFIAQIRKPYQEIKKDIKTNSRYEKNDRNNEKLLKELHLSGYVMTINNIYYLYPFKFNLPNIKIIRPFLRLGEYRGKDFQPDNHLAHYLPSINSIPLDEKEKNLYLAGESFALRNEVTNGFHIVSYNNINLGYGKVINGVLKNHYPKGLRIR